MKVVGVELRAGGGLNRSEKPGWNASDMDKLPKKLLRHPVSPKGVLLRLKVKSIHPRSSHPRSNHPRSNHPRSSHPRSSHPRSSHSTVPKNKKLLKKIFFSSHYKECKPITTRSKLIIR